MDMDVFLRSAKELARHLFLKLHADHFFDRIRPGSAVKGDLLEAPTRRERFSAIYDRGLWQHSDAAVPGSGQGSSLEVTTTLRTELPTILNLLGVKVLIDLGCGDFTWMRTLSLEQKYIGVDVVPSVVEANMANFSDAKRSFICLDVAEDDLPDGDAILCREVLFHLSFEDICAVLRNCNKKPRRYLMTTTDSSTLINSDIRSGDFRRLNLSKSPFHFPAPDQIIADDAIEKGRKIGVWRWERLPL
jgi:hypothetical protein